MSRTITIRLPSLPKLRLPRRRRPRTETIETTPPGETLAMDSLFDLARLDDPPIPPRPSVGARLGRLVPRLSVAGGLDALMILVLIAGLWIFVAALPPFAFGVWYQSEPVTLALWAVGALLGALLMIQAIAGRPVLRAAAHPAVILPLGLALWTALGATQLALPWRSWFGAPETGEGGLWWLALAVQIWAGRLVWPRRAARMLLPIAAGGAMLAMIALQLGMPEASPWRVGAWSEYLAFAILFCAIAGVGVMPRLARPSLSRRRRIALWVGLTLAAGGLLAGLYVSGNRAALLLTLLTLSLWPLIRALAGASRRGRARWAMLIGLTAPFAGVALLSVLVTLPDRIAIDRFPPGWDEAGYLAANPDIAEGVTGGALASGFVHWKAAGWSENRKGGFATPTDVASVAEYPHFDPAFLRTMIPSAQSRLRFNAVGLAALLAEPAELLTGRGYASFNDSLLRHAYAADVSNVVNGVWQPNWEALGAGAFHAHNAYLETLLNLGVPGLALFIGLMLTPVIWGRRRQPLALGLWLVVVMLFSVWFLLPMLAPFLALALVALTTPRRLPVTRADPVRVRARVRGGLAPGWRTGEWTTRGWMARAMPLAALVVFAPLALALVPGWTAAHQGRALLDAVQGPPADAERIRPLIADHGRGNPHLWWVALNLVEHLERKASARAPISEHEIWWFDVLNRLIEARMAEGGASERLAALPAIMTNVLAAKFRDTEMTAFRERQLAEWGPRMGRLLDRLPSRGDLAAPYLLWLAEVGDDQALLAFTQPRLRRAPDDPVLLWFSGMILAEDPMQIGEGKARLKRAFETGIDRFLPIDRGFRNRTMAEILADPK